MSKSIAKIRAEKKSAEYLDTFVRTPTGIMTRRQNFSSIVIGKSKEVRTHAAKKVNGCYAKLKNPKTIYFLDTLQNVDGKPQEIFYEVPKVVYDTYIAVER